MHFDKYNILGQIQSDGTIEGGDSVNWMGHYIYLTDNQDYPFHKTFNHSFGSYVRHPVATSTYNGFGAYYKNPWDGCISRDQMTGILAGLIKQKEYTAILSHMLHHLAWFWLFSYNTRTNGEDPKKSKWKWPDFTGPDIWAMQLRGLGIFSYLFYPILIVLDLHMLVNTFLHNYKNEEDNISYLMKLFVSNEYCPTPISVLSFKILNKDKAISNVKKYWCGWRDNCQMSLLYINKIDNLTNNSIGAK